jgi:hypothetical protein
LVERFVYTEDVRSSSLLSPTIKPPYYYNNPCKFEENKDYPENWLTLRNILREGDEVWSYDAIEYGTYMMRGSTGYALVRQGQIIYLGTSLRI